VDPILDPAHIDATLDSRAVSFENPTGARGAGGTAHGGRKGAPSRIVRPGQTVLLADLEGPGTIRHMWLTIPPAPPEVMRAVTVEVRYDGAAEPSIAVPVLDLFGLPHGRPVPYASALTTAQEGRGFNAYLPMPFHRGLRMELTNHSDRAMPLYYQLDLTLGPVPADAGVLHVSWRREDPTTRGVDMTITDGLRGPGRFLGCALGVRVIDDGSWYGEGEVKVYRDGDTDLPTICGTGLEDYVGTAWGMGPHHAPYSGAPLVVAPGGGEGMSMGRKPELVGCYRWHVVDPIMFATDLRVTVQQIGFALFTEGQDDAFAAYRESNPAAGAGWVERPAPGVLAYGIAERVDDVCATAFVYCREVQPVPAVDVALATRHIERRDHERPSATERMMSGLG
jgi:hypothetical protein